MKASIGKVCDADYYTRDVAEDRHDYYAGHGEAAGQWAGTHAATLGLNGEVDAAAFAEVLANHHPDTGEKLKPHDNLKNLAYDVTFSPVKSVSVLWALADRATRARIVEALEAGHAAGLAYLEQSACVARLGCQGADAQPGTGFAAAVFRHRFSREGDPQLHWHTVLANVAQAGDGRAAALDGALLYAHGPTAAAIAERVARNRLAGHGVNFERRRDRWEVAAVPPALARQFSKRRARIEQAVADRGGDLNDGRAAQQAALATRPAKDTAAGDVHIRWHAEALAAGHDPAVLADQLHVIAALDAGAADPDHAVVVDAATSAARRQGGEGPAARDAGAEVDQVEMVVDRLLGPRGLTRQASSFGRRDVLAALADQLPLDHATPADTVAQLHAAADRLLADPRVIPLLNPTLTTGEVIRPRDPAGRITAAVRNQAERRYSTADLLAAEHELLTRGQARADTGAAQVPAHLIQQAVEGAGLDADQEAMVRAVTTSGAGVDVVVGKAGTGKTTAIKRAVDAFAAAGHPVLGVAPSATAAHQLSRSTGMPASTVDRLLVELDVGRTHLPAGVVVVLDEAGMCSTRRRLDLQRAVDAVGGKVIDIGDDRQIPSVDVGGGFHALGAVLGASTLGVNHRFRDPQYRDAADLIWHGQPDQAVATLEAVGAVYEHPHPDVVNGRMVADWADLRGQGLDARMFATTNLTVDALNDLARDHLQQAGALPHRGRSYTSPDGHRQIDLVAGDRVRLGRNQLLRHPDSTATAVYNGMEGTLVALTRYGVTVELDTDHQGEHTSGRVTLPAAYVGEHLNYGYARTSDSAQGTTIDHGLFAPTGFGSLERGYVALTRGQFTNRIYATTDNGWRDTLGVRAAHTPALHQHPDPARWPTPIPTPGIGAQPATGVDGDAARPEPQDEHRGALHLVTSADAQTLPDDMVQSVDDRPSPKERRRSVAAGQPDAAAADDDRREAADRDAAVRRPEPPSLAM